MGLRSKTPFERVQASIFKDTDLAALMVEVLSRIEKSKCLMYFHAIRYNVNYVGKLARDGVFEVYSEEGAQNFYTLRADKTLSVYKGDVLRQIKQKKTIEWKAPKNLREWIEFKKNLKMCTVNVLINHILIN